MAVFADIVRGIETQQSFEIVSEDDVARLLASIKDDGTTTWLRSDASTATLSVLASLTGLNLVYQDGDGNWAPEKELLLQDVQSVALEFLRSGKPSTLVEWIPID